MNKENLLLEIGAEEIPAGFVPGALNQLERLARQGLEEADLSYGKVRCVSTPRRLTLAVSELSARQPDRNELIKGPPARVAFAEDGTPTKAGEGFARKYGARIEDLEIEDSDKGPYVVLRRVVKGKATTELLGDVLPRIITSVPFAKTMRWGTETLRFARPIRWIVALYGGEVISFGLAGIESGAATRGHRFMSPEPVPVPSDFEGYIRVLEKHYVLADQDKRRRRLLREAENAAGSAGGLILPDEELVDINTFLTEYPTAVCGSFDRRFLDLPRDVLVTSMREHQKYFAVVDSDGELLPNFVAINNTASLKPHLVKEGHERVLRARLSDAAFFFEEDTKRPLEAFVPALAGMVFHERLGTLLDKTVRIQALGCYIAKQVAPDLVPTVERSAWLCKADLLSEMVGEFPSLQGTMGREYARLSGESREVAEAIAEHYMPVRSGGELPATLPGSILSISDKIDTICSTFALGLQPTGTTDPYGLRRLALGIIHILEEKTISVSLKALIAEAEFQIKDALPEVSSELGRRILTFFERRFANVLAGNGFEHDVVQAAVRADFDDVVDCRKRVEALAAVRSMIEFEPLSVTFKRVMNILKGFDGGAVKPSLLQEAEERELYQAYLRVEETVRDFLDADDYEKGLTTLLSLKPHIDGFFDNVLVMAEDPAVKINRLSLLWNIAGLFLRIGDLSAISVSENS